MPQSAKHLLIGSTEPCSGKSATILGVAHQLQKRNMDIAYGKPLGSWLEDEGDRQGSSDDGHFLKEILQLPSDRLHPTLLCLDPLTVAKRLRGDDARDYRQALQDTMQAAAGDLVLWEGPADLMEGRLFDLSLLDMAEVLSASVLLVSRFHIPVLADRLLEAKRQLGDRLAGAFINDIPPDCDEQASAALKQFLEHQGIPVLGMMPRSAVLRSVSVRYLMQHLDAEVLSCRDRLDLMVESLQVGAMGVNLAMRYFQEGKNMAIVMGGDRTDLQLAALESSTHCLVLTGQMHPLNIVLTRAEEVEIPILSVALDTLTTVERIDRLFGQVRLHEPIKVEYIRQTMGRYLDTDRLLDRLGFDSLRAAS
ncbi:MAG: phosphotransacetylase family protein [Coleofasciculaceae cyanobacterium SM2_3_26]|nr:phosphotransacetylase family protein [Coleofasciculaceae cyanobacterium SM2_3_26]